MPLLLHLTTQAAVEYGGVTAGAATAPQGEALSADQLLDRLFGADPLAVAVVVLGLLVVVALFRTRRYRS